MLYKKKSVLKNFPKFTRNYLCQSFFFNKVASASEAYNFIKRDPGTGLSDSNGIRTSNHLVRKRTLNQFLAKWLIVHLQTKWLLVRIPLLSLKLQLWHLLQARSSLTFRQIIECRFTLKLTRDMVITYSLAQALTCEFCKIFKNTYFEEHMQTTASIFNCVFS